MPSPAEVHDLAGQLGIELFEPRFTMLERTYLLTPHPNYPGVVEELADWLTAVVDVLCVEPDGKLFPLLSRLANLAIGYSFDTTIDRSTTQRLSHELWPAFQALRRDRAESRAGFVLALTRAAPRNRP